MAYCMRLVRRRNPTYAVFFAMRDSFSDSLTYDAAHCLAVGALLAAACRSSPANKFTRVWLPTDRIVSTQGLWGKGSAFENFEAFLDSMKKRGVSFLEMLAMEMKLEGFYVARGLSFRC